MRVIFTICLFIPSLAFAIGEPKHSKVDVKTMPVGKNMAFEFKVGAKKKDMVLSFDAPWKLELTNAEGIKFQATKLNKAKMDEKLPGWKVLSSMAPTKKNGKFDYKLTAFVCTKAKTKCYREVHKGSVPWKVAAK